MTVLLVGLALLASAALGYFAALSFIERQRRRDTEAALRALARAVHPLLPLTDAAQLDHAVALGQALARAYYALGEVYPVAPPFEVYTSSGEVARLVFGPVPEATEPWIPASDSEPS